MWTYGGVRIYAQTDTDVSNQIVPRLQPLGGATVLQIFGHESNVKTISALVVGKDDAEHLKTLTASGIAFSLVGPEGTVGNFIPKSVTVARQMSVYQTMRADLDCTAPVYNLTLEIYKS